MSPGVARKEAAENQQSIVQLQRVTDLQKKCTSKEAHMRSLSWKPVITFLLYIALAPLDSLAEAHEHRRGDVTGA